MNPPTSAFVHAGADVAASCRLGDYVAVYAGARIDDDCEVLGFTQVWRGVRIGPGVVLEPPGDDADAAIHLGAACQVGANATIGRGVRIGAGAVVEPGSVVAQSVPAHAIVRGAPARVVGYVEQPGAADMPAWRHRAEFPPQPSVSRLGVGDVTLHRHKLVRDPRGDLVFGECPRDIPFQVRRYFLVFGVPSEKTRGEHAHRACKQYLICVRGSCAVLVDDGRARCEVALDSPDLGIYLPPMTWGVQYKYTADALLLVFTSEYYDDADYIRHYPDFLAEANRRRLS
ncbi:MAG: WxcM-like domain-containing protein [Pseudomonadota bacterium]